MSEQPQRETTTIVLPKSGATVTLKAWLTGGEKMEFSKVDRTDPIAASRALAEMIVIDTSWDDLCAMHGQDFDFVMDAATKVISDSSYSPKSEPSEASTAS